VTRVGPEVNTVAAGAGKSRCVDQSGLFSSACREKSSYREAKTTKGQTIPKRTEPAFFEPMQCKPVTALPAGVKWTFEIKFDGWRCIAVKRGREVTLFSRHRKVLNRHFSSVIAALVSFGGDFVLDGELVALDSQGKPSFQLLQHTIS
jgi:bifunctional non-homologous end joining protein LigD